VTDFNADPLVALLLDSLLPVGTSTGWLTPRPELRAEVLAATETPSSGHPFPGFRRRFGHLFDLSPAEADAVLLQMTEPTAWVPLKTFLIHPFLPGRARGDALASLIRCPPGLPFPSHRHVGTETSLFLRGAARDEDTGELLLPGELLTRPSGSHHRLSVLPPYECVFAVLLENGLPDFD